MSSWMRGLRKPSSRRARAFFLRVCWRGGVLSAGEIRSPAWGHAERSLPEGWSTTAFRSLIRLRAIEPVRSKRSWAISIRMRSSTGMTWWSYDRTDGYEAGSERDGKTGEGGFPPAGHALHRYEE